MRTTRRHRLVSLLVASVLLAGGCTQKPQRPPASLPAAQPELTTGEAPSSEPFSGPRYESESSEDPVRGAAADARLRDTFERACAASGLTPDGRLGELAHAILRTSGVNRPGGALVSFHAQRLGLAEPTPQIWLATTDSTRTIAPVLAKTIREAALAYPLTHCGAAAVRRSSGLAVGIALSQRAFTLQGPVPRARELGEALAVSGTLADGYRGPELALAYPDGNVVRQPLGDGRDFAFTLRPSSAGKYVAELLAQGPEGFSVIAILPLYIGVPIATESPAPPSEPAESDPAEVARKLLALIASERSRHGLAPLRVEPRLVAIASAHCDDMLRHHFVAHTSPRTGDASDRLRAAGLEASVVLENIGRAYSADELHEGLMQSPGHRGNILHPDAREIGLAVVAEPEGERLAFLATQLFTQLAP